MAKIPDLSAPSLRRFVRDNVQWETELRTDAWSGYNGIEGMGYKHTVTNIADSEDPAHVVMPRVHRVASLLDRWWLGIHHVKPHPIMEHSRNCQILAVPGKAGGLPKKLLNHNKVGARP